MSPFTKWFGAAAAAAAVAGSGPAMAQDVIPAAGILRKPCPPVLPVVPCPPGTEMPTSPRPDPSAQQPSDEPGPRIANTFAGLGNSAATNMMGNLLGARSLSVRYQGRLAATFPATIGQTVATVTPNVSGATITFSPRLPDGSFGAAVPANPPFAGVSPTLAFDQPLQNGTVSFDRAFAQSILQSLFSTGQLTPEQLRQFRNLSAADQSRLNAAITQATKGLTIPGVTVSNVTASPGTNAVNYGADLSADVLVPLPGAGGVVGRVKMSEDNSPLPRDRFIFNYDYFDAVPFTPGGMNVNRFQFGVEKTFLDGRASLEFRLPFAGTLDSTTTQGSEARNTEFGNLRLALKYLWFQSEYVSLSSGAAVTFPTSDDLVVRSAMDGKDLYRFKSQSYQFEPFVGVLLTPTDRLFGQVWSGVNFDASGSRLIYNSNVFGNDPAGSTRSVRFWDVPCLSVDGQVGYWLVKKDTGWLRGLAPFVELHWDYAILQDRLIRSVGNRTQGQGLTIGATGSRELNLTAGASMFLGDNLSVAIGGSAPMFSAPHRTFDAQFSLRVNYYFGSLGGPVVNNY